MKKENGNYYGIIGYMFGFGIWGSILRASDIEDSLVSGVEYGSCFGLKNAWAWDSVTLGDMQEVTCATGVRLRKTCELSHCLNS